MSIDQVMENEEFQKYWLTHANESNKIFSSLLSKGVIAIGGGLLIIGLLIIGLLIGFILAKWL